MDKVMGPLYVTACAAVSALGRGTAATLEALQEGRSGLRRCDFEHAELDTFIGRVQGLESERVAMAHYDCRNNRLAQLALQQDDFEEAVAHARERYRPHRIGVFIGTSTSGIQETERAYRNRDPETGALPSGFHYGDTSNLTSVADYVRRYLNLRGPLMSISTACSSSAKVFAVAHRFMQAGLCDAAVVGGVDSLCLSTLYGFNSLELLSTQPCRPADRQRDGISIGEAGGFALLEQASAASRGTATVALLGYGESSDAHHMSSPHPEGTGARLAMERALHYAGLEPAAIDYINLHGTATVTNDLMEDQALCALFGTGVPCSSTKGWTGHALGAAGLMEALICWLSIEHDLVPGSLNTRELDPAINSNVVLQNRQQTVRRVLSNSFGFGGSNCSLIFGRIG
jgi:3-oxoacyl-[acyl-carrier-protein] synthase-1